MRQLKFRVCDIKHNVMTPAKNQIGYCDFDIKTGGRITREIIGNGLCGLDRNTTENQENYIIQQFTGLLDINGKEIYEGDIVRDLDGDNCTIEFNHGSFIVKGKIIIPFWSILSVNGELSARTVSSKTFEIIGNIFENPELTEKK